MIEIYKDKTLLNEHNLIEKVDMTFDSIAYKFKLKEIDKIALKIIDNAIYDGNGYVTTPFGRTVIQNISTGCKTLIILNHSKELGDKVISIAECGTNVLDIIFTLNDSKLYMPFTMIPSNYDGSKTVKIYEKKKIKKTTLGNYFGGIK